MTTATLPLRRPPVVQRPILASVLLVFGALITTAATVAGNGNLLLGVIPIAVAAAAYAFYVLPLRYTLFTLIFLSLALDAIGDGPWDSPFAPLGSLIGTNLNLSLPISALVFPGAAVLMIAMVALRLHRSVMNDRTDSQGRTPTVLPLFAGLAVSFLTIVGLVALGALRGGDLQMAKNQVQSYLMLLLLAYVATMSLRGVNDYRRLGQILVGAALARSFYVMWVVWRVNPYVPAGEELHAAGTHGDSLIFATAAVLLVVRLMEQPSRRAATWCALFLPILTIAMSLNSRRLVYVEVVAGLLTFIVVSRRSRMKRLAANVALCALPVMVGYVAVGWNSQSQIFAPIQMYRSVTDGEVDSSTLYRDLEDYNLIMTMRIHQTTGMGFGQPFLETVTLPSIQSFFKEYRYLPHNAILGLWAFTGPFGFTGLWLPVVIAVYLAMRSYRLTDSPEERVAAIMVLATIVIYFAHCWGDIGFSERRTIYLVGPVLAIAGQLAYRTGAYKRHGRLEGLERV